MNTTPRVLANIGGRSTYSGRDRVYDPDGVSPTVMANWGIKSPPPLVGIEKRS